MNVLGISCYFHDSAASLWSDGKLVAAAQEERFNRKKNTSEFPIQAINSCFQASGLSLRNIDYIGFYEKPYYKFYRVVFNHLKSWPWSYPNFRTSMPKWLKDRLTLPLTLKNELGFDKTPIFVPHHLSHAASAFLLSPFERAAICTADSVGEWATLSCGIGEGKKISISKELRYPHSLGLVYSAMTTYLGFKAYSGEGKVMGLASYGKPSLVKKFDEIVKVKDDGSFWVDERYFRFNAGHRMYGKKIEELFGPERVPESPITDRHKDIAASLQNFFEDILLKTVQSLKKETKAESLCLAGGVFLNCSANQRILEDSGFKNVFIQPAAGDAGGALGVAAYINHNILGYERNPPQISSSLGPSFNNSSIEMALRTFDFKYKRFQEEELIETTARALADGKTVGWFQGRAEFGPRALGNRSILASPLNESMRDYLNSEVKRRELFRPFGPVVPEESAVEYFEIRTSSPFMLLAPQVKREARKKIPAVTHADGTARVQTLNRDTNPRLYSLLRAFEKLTTIPVLINTSFNLRGEPIVGTPEDALTCFRKSKLDFLALEDYWVSKN
jgi:carbamoyltransferase